MYSDELKRVSHDYRRRDKKSEEKGEVQNETDKRLQQKRLSD